MEFIFPQECASFDDMFCNVNFDNSDIARDDSDDEEYDDIEDDLEFSQSSGSVAKRSSKRSFSDSDISDDDTFEHEDNIVYQPNKAVKFSVSSFNTAPMEPIIVSTTSFHCSKSLGELYSSIEHYLKSANDIKFSRSFYSYTIECFNGSSICRIKMNLYSSKHDTTGTHVVDLECEEGDLFMFYDIFTELKTLLLDEGQDMENLSNNADLLNIEVCATASKSKSFSVPPTKIFAAAEAHQNILVY